MTEKMKNPGSRRLVESDPFDANARRILFPLNPGGFLRIRLARDVKKFAGKAASG